MYDMSGDSELDNRSALLVEAGEILQMLTPSRFATLLFVSDNDIETQAEMADILGISPPTVSTYLKSFEDLPLSLTKRERHYKITPAGDTIIELLDSMLGHLGKDLNTVDWGDEGEREQINELLAPLHNSRSMVPFFILYGIGQRSAIGERLDRFVSPQSVQFKDIIADVKQLQAERGQSSSRKQVRGMLARFEKFDTIEFDGENIKLEEKGQEQVRLLERLIDLLEEDETDESSEDTSPSSSSSTQLDSSTARPWTTDQSPDAAERIGPQLGLKGFYESRQEDVGASEEALTIVPAYCLSPPNSEGHSQSQPSAVLPLTPTTSVEDLANQITRLGREYGNAQLELYWALWSGSELYPLETSPDDESNERSPPPQS
jgi:DNA-binding MarR family transcriptional regulator